MTSAGEASFAEFWKGIFAEAHELGRHRVKIKLISTGDYQTPTRCPANSSFFSGRPELIYGISLPDRHDSLKPVVTRRLPANSRTNMRGIISAGGSSSTLQPMAQVASKQTLLVYDKPMIYVRLQC